MKQTSCAWTECKAMPYGNTNSSARGLHSILSLSSCCRIAALGESWVSGGWIPSCQSNRSQSTQAVSAWTGTQRCQASSSSSPSC